VAASIDVVVLAYNGWELTASCLRHLAAQTAPHTVIVVDNGSTDETPHVLAREFPGVRLVRLDRNHAFTRAVNIGVAAGEGEVVVLLNNDVDLDPDCLEQLTAPLEQDDAVGAVATVMLTPGRKRIDSAGVTTDVILSGFARLQGRDPAAAAEPEPVLTGPEGTAAAYRRSAWEQVEGLDETMSAYMEILDLAWRLRSAGWRAALAPGARGVHLGSATFGSGSPLQRRLAGFSRGYLLRRYGVMRSRWALRAAVTEATVMLADAAARRDLQATRGRLEGWRAARGLPRHPRPPADAIDSSIGFRASLALRRRALGD